MFMAVLLFVLWTCSKHLEKFRWDDLAAELKSRAPVLHEFLSMCVDVKRRQRSFKKTHRTSNAAVMGVCASLLLRHKNQHMNALQHIVSLINPRRASAARVTVVGLCVCVFVCLSTTILALQATRRLMSDTNSFSATRA